MNCGRFERSVRATGPKISRAPGKSPRATPAGRRLAVSAAGPAVGKAADARWPRDRGAEREEAEPGEAARRRDLPLRPGRDREAVDGDGVEGVRPSLADADPRLAEHQRD